jgi:riboflavin kinase/FMN adenylyltransferase
MRIVHDLARVHPASRSYATVGVFDGVHRGHQQLITEMVKAAHSKDNITVALAFDPHPATVLGAGGNQPPEPPLLLTTVEERAELLAALGLDVLIVLPFTPATAHTRAADFIDSLLHHLHLAELWGGPDSALGYQREGNIPFLHRLGVERGFAVRVVEPLVWEGALVSSSRVRAALNAGDIAQATGCLGRPYRLVGTVVHRDRRGHAIGIPTANVSLSPERLIPTGGVYACLAHTEHLGAYPAAANIGTRPTFASGPDDQRLVVEAHLLDFDADLYSQTLALDFIARLRDERAFPTVDALVEQIHKDIAQARAVLGDANC